ncbi:hypothetical protein ACJX0J_031959 [Zea mays]
MCFPFEYPLVSLSSGKIDFDRTVELTTHLSFHLAKHMVKTHIYMLEEKTMNIRRDNKGRLEQILIPNTHLYLSQIAAAALQRACVHGDGGAMDQALVSLKPKIKPALFILPRNHVLLSYSFNQL